jgi:hypothetical protein
MRQPDDFLSPATILPAGHEPVHEVVAVSDAREHALDMVRSFRSIKVCH